MLNKKLLKNRNYILLIIGRFTSTLGTNVQNFALALYVLNKTGNPTLFASVVAAAYIPQILLSPFTGVIADRYDRKKIIIGLDLISGLVVGGFAILHVVMGTFSILNIYTIQILLGIISSFFKPTTMAVIPNVIPKEDRTDAVSFDSFLNSIASVIAPLIGVFIFSFGIVPVMAVNSISFILSGISEMFIKIPKLDVVKKKINLKLFLNDSSEGVKFIVNNKKVLGFCLTAISINFALVPLLSIIIPYILKKELNVSNYTYGLVSSLMVTGMFISPIIAPILLKRISPRKVNVFNYFFVSSILIIGSVLFFLRSAGYYNHSILLVSIGFIGWLLLISTVISTIDVGVTFQQEVPNELFGRVGGLVNTIMLISLPIGQMLSGVLLNQIGITYIFLLISLIIALFGIVYIFFTRDIEPKTKTI